MNTTSEELIPGAKKPGGGTRPPTFRKGERQCFCPPKFDVEKASLKQEFIISVLFSLEETGFTPQSFQGQYNGESEDDPVSKYCIYVWTKIFASVFGNKVTLIISTLA